MSVSVKWKRSPREVAAELERVYGDKIIAAIGTLMYKFAGDMEAAAKAPAAAGGAPWRDQTGNARQSLFTVLVIEPPIVKVYLSHGMVYGKWLELCNQGKYAIILPTMQRFYPQIIQALRDMFR